jgi:hypothetical protein
MAIDTIKSTAVLDGAIATADIADDAVTTDKLANAINTDIAAKAPTASPAFTGNVGIGTSNPDAPLHVEATNASMLLSNSGRTQYWRIQNNESSDALVFNANDSAERMRIDNAGYVTKAFQPAFGVGRGGGNVAINTDYVWDTVRFNIGSHYNTSNGRFTAPVDGRYHFDINLMSNDIIYNNKFWQLRLNGSEYQRIYSTNGGAYHHRWNWNGTLELSANDYIVVHSYSVGLYGGNALYSHFSGYLLG